MTPSVYLTIRVLLKLSQGFPLTYLVDSIHWTNFLDELKNLLKKRGFELLKWISNNRKVLPQLPPSSLKFNPLFLVLETASTVKMLGLECNPVEK